MLNNLVGKFLIPIWIGIIQMVDLESNFHIAIKKIINYNTFDELPSYRWNISVKLKRNWKV